MEELIIDIGLCLFGSGVYILFKFKNASDKFENKRTNFKSDTYARKNKWDFIFYIGAGLVVFTIKEVISTIAGVEQITDAGLSCVSGFFGSVILQSAINKFEQKK